MNSLSGQIKSIDTSGDLSLVKVTCQSTILSAIIIDTPASAPYLIQDTEIKVLFKETEVSIALTRDKAISIENQIPCIIESIETGALLSKLVLKTDKDLISSIITTSAMHQLKLREGLSVAALIKTNEIMLSD